MIREHVITSLSHTVVNRSPPVITYSRITRFRFGLVMHFRLVTTGLVTTACYDDLLRRDWVRGTTGYAAFTFGKRILWWGGAGEDRRAGIGGDYGEGDVMDQNMVLYMAKEAVGAVLLVGGPILGVSLLVGLLVSIFQAMTQIQEQTLTFIPKVVAVVVVLLVLGPWMLSVLTAYTSTLFKELATFGRL